MGRGSVELGIRIVLTLCVFGEIDAKDAENHTPVDRAAVIDSLYQVAVQQMNGIPISQSIDSFKRVLKADRKYAPACYNLSLLYTALNTVNDRQRANRAIREAIRLDPDNIDYQLALGDLLWAQGHWSNAERQYKKTFQLDSLNVEAAYKIGSRALDEYLKYKDHQHLDVIRAPDPRIRPSYYMVYWKVFSDRELERATSFLERATQIDPTYRHVYYRLGLAYYESNRPGQLVQVSARLFKHVPGDKDALLFMALGSQAINRLDQSDKLFSAALKRMDPDERAVMESLDLVGDPETQQQIRQAAVGLADSTKNWADSDACSLFWQKQDPLYLTDYNERRIAHYGRVAYANLRYSRPERNIPGWQTDMGRAYIKYGRYLNRRIKRADEQITIPIDVIVERAAEIAFGNAGRPFDDQTFKSIGRSRETLTRANFQTETWNYENFRLEFVSADGYNSRLVNSTPDRPRYVDPYIRVKYSTPHQMLAFKDPAGVRLEVAYALPQPRLAPQQAILDNGLFVFDPSGHEIDRYVQQTDLSQSDTETHIDHTLYLPPGEYHFVAEALDRQTGSIATFRETRTLTFPDTGLAASDLFLARHIQEKTPFPETHADLDIQANPTRTYKSTDPVFIYLELYNLARDAYGRTRFDIAYRLSVPDKSEIDPTLFLDLDLNREPTVEMLLIVETPSPQLDEAEDPEHRERPVNQHASTARVEHRVKYTLPKSRETNQLKRATHEGVQMATSVTAEYEGDRTDDFTYLQFDVSQLPKGIHKLTVTITDRFANAQTRRQTLFRVVE